jgi:site-specific DNA-methyltransferase (adenine-specific)
MPPVHPAAEIFPLLRGQPFDELVEDIREHGQRQTIVMFGAQLLDGRNRWRACEALGVEPRVEQWDEQGSPVAFVISLNAKRRHLTSIQAATAAAKAADLFEAEARQAQKAGKSEDGQSGGRGKRKRKGPKGPKVSRQDETRRSTARAAKQVGAGTRQTKQMRWLRKNYPAVFRAVEDRLFARISDAISCARLEPAECVSILEMLSDGTCPDFKTARKELRRKQAESAAKKNKKKKSAAWIIHTLDIAAASKVVARASIDAIITDPPYAREHLPLYDELSTFAAHALKPGGSCVVMVGQSHLPEVLRRLGKHLRYHWTLAYLTPGGQSAQVWDRKVNTFWKPLLWFVNGDYASEWVGDVARSDANANDKRFHDWGQSESGMLDIVGRLSKAGEVICDPFCGAASTGLAALALGRRFIGIEIDPKIATVARGRFV